MNGKMKIMLSVLLIILLVGCGKTDDIVSEENSSGGIIWNVKYSFGENIAKTITEYNILKNYKMIDDCLAEYKDNYLEVQNNNAELVQWVGEYKFDEAASGPPPMVMSYEIEIYEEEGKYFAEIEQIGQTTMAYIKAEVRGNKDEIYLLFNEYLPDNVWGPLCEEGDILIKFAKEKGKLCTYWGKIAPLLNENEELGKVYFVKEADHISEELPSWLGEYTFSEVSNNSEYPFKRLDYRIRIYQDNDRFFAEVQADEEKPYVRVKAEVRGNKDEIRLRFIETLPEHMRGEIYDEGLILLKLKKEDGEIRTDWGGIVPMVKENREFGRVYFEKVE